jgi:cell shape-determining protein MreD
MLVAFVLGLSVDIISAGVLGSHAAACTLMAYCRNIITKVTMPRGDYENTSTATALHINLRQFILYAFLLVFLHHFILFFVEIFTLKNFIFTLIQIIASSAISTVFIILFKLLFGYKKDVQ